MSDSLGVICTTMRVCFWTAIEQRKGSQWFSQNVSFFTVGLGEVVRTRR